MSLDQELLSCLSLTMPMPLVNMMGHHQAPGQSLWEKISSFSEWKTWLTYKDPRELCLYPIFPIIWISMQVCNSNNKDLCIQYLIYDSVRKTTQLTSASNVSKRVPRPWKLFYSFKGVKHFYQKLITQSGM